VNYLDEVEIFVGDDASGPSAGANASCGIVSDGGIYECDPALEGRYFYIVTTKATPLSFCEVRLFDSYSIAQYSTNVPSDNCMKIGAHSGIPERLDSGCVGSEWYRMQFSPFDFAPTQMAVLGRQISDVEESYNFVLREENNEDYKNEDKDVLEEFGNVDAPTEGFGKDSDFGGSADKEVLFL